MCILTDEQPLWSTTTPLIYFEIIEWHSTDCIMCQFGLEQDILDDLKSLLGYHNKDLRGAQATNWIEKHKEWLHH